jgi:hypothetical protein
MRIGLWEVGGNQRTTLRANSLNMIGFNYPAPVMPKPVAIKTRRVVPIEDGVLVGWHSSAGDPDVAAPGISGVLSEGNLFSVDGSGGSTDGTFGTAPGASVDLTVFAVRATNGVDTAVFSLVNRSGVPVRLDAIHFDYSSWWANSPRDVVLAYESGDLTDVSSQTVIQSMTGLSNTGKSGNYPDFDWSLAVLNDRVLEHGEGVHFSLQVSNAGADWANGAFDNIAISGGTVSNSADSVLVSWRAHTGDQYTVMRATGLESNDWQSVSGSAIGWPGDMSEGVELSPPAFYRLNIRD